VSEYQYYEFRALDRRLTPEQQQRRLRALSSRAEISATWFTNEDSFRDFSGDPEQLLEEYFDAYLYAARELAFRLPRTLASQRTGAATAFQGSREGCEPGRRLRAADRGRPQRR
jgi:hypothetical protein